MPWENYSFGYEEEEYEKRMAEDYYAQVQAELYYKQIEEERAEREKYPLFYWREICAEREEKNRLYKKLSEAFANTTFIPPITEG